jgi:hypothetical protein
MNRFAFLSILIILVFLASLSLAEIPKMINYQGMLTDSATGDPLNGTPDITFRIYNASSGGTMKWDETHYSVPVTDGLFNVILGSESGGIDLDFSEEYWLEIEVNSDTMPERLRFTSVGYAYRAMVADSAVVSSPPSTGGGWTDNGAVVRLTTSSDKVGIGTSDPNEEMEIYKDQNYWTNLRFNNPSGGSNAGCAIEFYEGGNQRAYIAKAGSGNTTANPGPNSFCIQNWGPIEIDTWTTDPVTILPFGGNVGIGTRDAERILHIKGDNPRILIEAATSNPEINFEHSGDLESEIWALYKHGASGDFRFYQNGADRLTIQNATGNVGIGATDPAQKLDVNGIVRIRSWGSTPTHDVQVNAYGDLCRVSSSKRYKKNIRGLEYHLDKILDLKPVSFEWKTTSEQDIGLIAEDVHELIPELVGYDKEGRPDAVRYELVSLYLLEVMKDQVEAIKELRTENQELRQRVEALEGR